MPTIRSYKTLQGRFTDWFARQPGSIALILVGSRARGGQAADAQSDLDLAAFVTDPGPFIDHDGWLAEFGRPIAPYLETEHTLPEWLVIYASGLKLDIAIVTVREQPFPRLPALLAAFPFQDVLARGYQVLVDKTTSAGEQILPAALPARHTRPPSESEFHNHIYDLWQHAHKAAKFAARGDLWRAAHALHVNLRLSLLTLIEWHARSLDPQVDTWYSGRNLQEWAAPQVLEELPVTFARYDPADLHRAALAVLDLSHWLAAETAGRLGYSYPQERFYEMRRLVEKISPRA